LVLQELLLVVLVEVLLLQDLHVLVVVVALLAEHLLEELQDPLVVVQEEASVEVGLHMEQVEGVE
jgi:hypothetical protein